MVNSSRTQEARMHQYNGEKTVSLGSDVGKAE